MSFIEVPERDIREQAEHFIYATVEPRDNVDLILDGKKHRIALVGDKGREQSGEYRFYTDKHPAGRVIDYRNGIYEKWKFDFQALKDSQPNIYAQSQTKEFKAEAKRNRQEREEREAKERQEALKKLKTIWDAAQPAVLEHPYLRRKNMQIYDFRQGTGNILLVPIYDIEHNFRGLQSINKEGGKLFAGGSDASGAFYVFGGFNLKSDENIVVCEGIATGAAIYEAIKATQPEVLSNIKIVAAMNCGNLLKVCTAIQNRFKPKCLLVAADDDSRSPKHKEKGDNPGVEHALACVKSGAANDYVIPPFDNFDFDEEGATDFWDFDNEHGHKETAQFILNAIKEATPEPWIMSAQDLLDTYTPTEWLIEDWLPEQSQTLLFGASGAGKSFITLDMAASIACPDIADWHGLNIEHGSVLYLCGEGRNGLIKRLKGWTQYHEIEKIDNLYITKSPININDDNAANMIIDEINKRKIQGLKLFIIDTLNRHFQGNENDAGEASRFLNQILAVQTELKCASLIVHHNGVASDAQDRGRGSSAFKGAVDMELKVTHSKVENTDGINFFVELSQTKNKDDELKEALTFKRVSLPLNNFHYKNGRQVYTAVLERQEAPDKSKSSSAKNEGTKLTPKQAKALNSYVKAAQTAGIFTDGGNKFYGIRFENWRTEYYKQSSADTNEGKRKAFQRAREMLTEELNILISESDGKTDGKGNDNFIYRPQGKFSEYIETAGLKDEWAKITPTSRSESI